VLENVEEPAGFYRYYEVFPKSRVERLIPAHYRNAVGIISSKIRWLQLASSKKPRSSLNAEQQQIFQGSHDGLRRNLEFTIAIRKIFYEDLEKINDQDPDSFSSQTFDSWIYTEYFSATHQPPTYWEYLGLALAEILPLDIPIKGLLSLCMQYSLLISE
jgi:hypothetical protein